MEKSIERINEVSEELGIMKAHFRNVKLSVIDLETQEKIIDNFNKAEKALEENMDILENLNK